MQNWQKNRNYRKHKNPDGTITHIITIDGADIAVDAELYREYARYDRMERYQAEREVGLLLSLERMEEDGVPHLIQAGRHTESAEESAIRQIVAENFASALSLLCPKEWELLNQLFYQNIPAREVARTSGVYHSAIIYRRNAILKKLQRIMQKDFQNL